MKNIFVKLISSFLFLLALVSYLSAQDRYDPHGQINDQLLNLIHARYGSDLQYVQFTIFDSLLSHSLVENKRIRDPYNTLKGCILFSTYKSNAKNEPNNFIVGVVKNAQIIWDNAPGTNADLGGDLLYAQDINNNGEVDLLFSENDREYLLMGKGPFLYYLYVLSWNGTQGKFINTFREDGKSALLGDGGFVLVDNNGDGIKEITTNLPNLEMDLRGYKTSTFPGITYSWNGKQYGLWPKVKNKK